MTERTCSRCQRTQPLTEYYRIKGTERRRLDCRTCNRERTYRSQGYKAALYPVGAPGTHQSRRRDGILTMKQLQASRHSSDPAVQLYREAKQCPKRKRRQAAAAKRLDAAVRRMVARVEWLRTGRPVAPLDTLPRQAAHEDESDFAAVYEGRSA